MDTAAVFRHPHVAFLALIAAILAQAGAPSAGDEPSPNSRGVVRIVFAGDVMLDGGPGHFAAHGGDPFAHLASVLRDADLTVANLECALATRGQSVHKDFTFLAKPNCLPILKRYFSAVSLANNHSGDWGKEGFASELELLESVRLPYFGGGRNAEAARRPPRGPAGLQ
jgi:poly-gamma-glutamate synthesis protein (capsule biosynthesis protein)